MKDHQRVTILVHGRVHGVFFRDSTMRKARELGLKGTVQNLPDGTVLIAAQGPVHDLDALIRWAHEGPPAAIVREVQVTYETPGDDWEDFRILF